MVEVGCIMHDAKMNNNGCMMHSWMDGANVDGCGMAGWGMVLVL